jgi:PKD repeat protein
MAPPMRLPLRSSLVAVAALLALSAPAAARTYAVTRASELSTALTQAAASAEADTIQLAAGTYSGQFAYNGLSDLTIAGAGAAVTTLANGAGGTTTLSVTSTANVTVQQLGVSITGGMTGYGFLVSGAHVVVQDVQVVDQPAATNATGIQLFGGATLRRATFTGAFARAVWVETGTTVADALTISGATTALEAEGAGTSLTATHVRTTNVSAAAAASFSGTVTVTDSLLQVRAGAVAATRASDNNNPAANASHLVLARDTLVAGGAGTSGVDVDAHAADAMTATITDTVMSGFTAPLSCSAIGGGSATITTTNLSYATGTDDLSGCPAGAVRQTNTIVAGPQFVSPASGDYRLRPTSPLLDVSDVAPAGGIDLDGRPRPADGTGDCVRRGDVGAYELLLAPSPSASASAASAETGAPVTFAGAACDSGSPNPVAYHWTFDDGASGDGQSVAHAFATAGTHVATLVVTDAEGQHASTQTAVTIVPPAPPSILRFAAPRGGFVLGRGLPRVGGSPRRSLTIELSKPATVTLTAARRLAGRLRNGSCVAPRRAPHGRRCTRRGLLGGAARLALPTGTSLVAFAGRLTRRAALRPGSWELTLVARDAGGLVSRPRRLVVAIRRPARLRRAR